MNKITDEKIESLQRIVKKKQKQLGITNRADLLTLKELRKYCGLKTIKFPKKITAKSLNIHNDYLKLFKFPIKKYEVFKHLYMFDQVVKEISKVISQELIEITCGLSISEASQEVNKYLRENTTYESLSIHPIIESDHITFANRIISSRTNREINNFYHVSNLNTAIIDATPQIVTISEPLPLNSKGLFTLKTGSINTGYIFDLNDMIAVALLLEQVESFLSLNPEIKNEVFEMINNHFVCNEEELENLKEIDKRDLLEKNDGNPPYILSYYINVALTYLLPILFEIDEYSEHVNSSNSDYAKTYQTKKNIPIKIQNFMNDNKFLTVFGEVEADEQCDVNMLRELENEFVKLTNTITIPQAKDHALRFRRLGKIKAEGAYYANQKTIAINHKTVNSFIHELFHLIDYSNDLMSLDTEFRTILNYYRTLMETAVNELPKDSPVYATWYSSNKKKSHIYYTTSRECFARLGELYTSHILKVYSSFNVNSYDSDMEKIVYIYDDKLLKMIEDYYGKIIVLKNKEESKKELETTPTINKEKKQPELVFRAITKKHIQGAFNF